MKIHEITFDWPKLPLSLNYRLHRMVEAKETKQIRKAAEAWARTLPRMGRCVVELEWFVNTRHQRDDENPVSTLKPFCDGLVDGGLVPGDTSVHMVKIMPRPTYRPKNEGLACVVFRVAEIPPAFRPDNVQAIVDRLGLEEQ